MENGDAGCQIRGKETANWFVMKGILNSLVACAD